MVAKTCAQIVFHSEEAEDNLKRIEIIGVSQKQKDNGNQIVSEDVYNFFDMFIATELFRGNRSLSQYSFEFLKIWVNNTNDADSEKDSPFPKDASPALQLLSELESSELKSISILDIGLSGNQKMLWERGCKELFMPLFRRFVPPVEPPDVMTDYLQMRFGKQLADKMDLYLHMRKTMCFDALIVDAK